MGDLEQQRVVEDFGNAAALHRLRDKNADLRFEIDATAKTLTLDEAACQINDACDEGGEPLPSRSLPNR